MQFRSVKTMALERGERQLKYPSFSTIDANAFWRWASRVGPILICITGILHGFPTNDTQALQRTYVTHVRGMRSMTLNRRVIRAICWAVTLKHCTSSNPR